MRDEVDGCVLQTDFGKFEIVWTHAEMSDVPARRRPIPMRSGPFDWKVGIEQGSYDVGEKSVPVDADPGHGMDQCLAL
jgi:hypothetical protein